MIDSEVGWSFSPDPNKPATMSIINERVHFTDMLRSVWGTDTWGERRKSWHTMWEVKMPTKIIEYQRLKT